MEKRFQMFTTQISKCCRMIKRIKTSEMKEFDLQAPHVSCLYYLFISNEPLTATELCEMCDEDKAYISRAIDSLEKEGCIVCESKTEKRYKSPLMLTEKGKKIAEKISEKIDSIVEKASCGLSAENREVFYQSLMLISDNLEKICKEYGEKENG